MIFVILGTQDKPFNRLLEAIEKCNIDDEIVVQAGFTEFVSTKMKVFDYVSTDDFINYLNKASLVITHGGVGSIMQALQLKHPVIAMARLAKYGEHHNNHQEEIVNNFSDLGYILKAADQSSLCEAIELSKTFKAVPFKSNNEQFMRLLEKYIEGIE